jgi:DNA polymerase III subunit epsilon
MYAVVDIETTGGSPVHEKITEIAVYLHDGDRVVEEFCTLINPEKNIPYHITQLTGISNEMVADAPRFYEVARKIVEITKDATFVAHNVSFDYGFIREEFRRLGFDYEREKLCTVKLSRKIFPGKRSYSLGNLCEDLGITLNNRHRASGDALATTRLLELLLGACAGKDIITEVTGLSMKGLHPSLDLTIFKRLPEEPGVYYFYNEQKDIVYVGKSRNVKQRVISHFSGTRESKSLRIREQVTDISVERTGSELVALLLESDEIKKLKPLFNRAQRRPFSSYGIVQYENPDGYLCFSIERLKEANAVPLDTFNSKAEATEVINNWINRYHLCQKLSGVYDSQGACFHYEIKECRGACLGLEPPAAYNQRAGMLVRQLQYQHRNMLIIDKGRSHAEKSVIKIENGHYIGFGYIDQDSINGIESFHDCVRPYVDNHDVQYILRSYLRKKKVEKIIEY